MFKVSLGPITGSRIAWATEESGHILKKKMKHTHTEREREREIKILGLGRCFDL